MDKALNEPDPERKMEFSNSIAYYMKLVYSTWHKELVHDDTIRTELNALTNGALEFNSTTPRIKHGKQPIIEDEEFNRSTSQNGSLNAPPARKQNFGNNRGSDTRSNNSGRNGGRSDGRSGSNNKGGVSKNGKNTSSNGRGGGDSSRNFKKRF